MGSLEDWKGFLSLENIRANRVRHRYNIDVGQYMVLIDDFDKWQISVCDFVVPLIRRASYISKNLPKKSKTHSSLSRTSFH